MSGGRYDPDHEQFGSLQEQEQYKQQEQEIKNNQRIEKAGELERQIEKYKAEIGENKGDSLHIHKVIVLQAVAQYLREYNSLSVDQSEKMLTNIGHTMREHKQWNQGISSTTAKLVNEALKLCGTHSVKEALNLAKEHPKEELEHRTTPGKRR